MAYSKQYKRLCLARCYFKEIRLLFFISLFFYVASSEPSQGKTLEFKINGNQEIVFDWNNDACSKIDSPDTGARAIRNSNNEIVLFASHSQTQRSSGESFYKLKHHCDISFEGNYNSDPAAYSDRTWISGIYTEDGKKIHALLHNEYHGHDRPDRCPSEDHIKCWRNSISLAVSNDGGATFKYVSPRHLVASLPYQFDANALTNTGYFNPTNIIKHGEFYYAMFAATEYKKQKYGLCVIRTSNPDNPSSWLAWDGKGFNVIFADAYRNKIAEPEKHVCNPVGSGNLNANIGGLVFHEPSKKFLITISASQVINAKKIYGFFVSSSRNLIDWSTPQLIMETPVSNNALKGKPCEALNVYPSLIDHASTDRSFNTIGNTPHLYFTRYYLNPENCNGTDRRDLLRIPIKITM